MKRYSFLLMFVFAAVSIAFSSGDECPGGDNGGNSGPEPGQHAAGSSSVFGGHESADPNELLGPAGIDSVRWVSVNDILNYTIFFENDPALATASAQMIDVRFDFPFQSLVKNFGLGDYCFANQQFHIPDYPSAFNTRLDLRDSMFIYVDLLAGVDVTKNQAFWHFSSIDPETGYAPWQVHRGMLPVNDSTHVGEGFVTFRLKPSDELQTGDTISIVANIVFDQNDTIATNRWCNKIDAVAPTSRVKGNVDRNNKLLYHLSFEASDDNNGCGLKDVRLFLADNMGTYEEIATCPVDTIIDFEIDGGRTYRLYSLAEDRVGNREALKDKPDLEINVNVAPTKILLSDSTFRDDIEIDGFIGQLSSVDTDGEINFTYSLSNGKGSTHNDMFKIEGDRLLAGQTFKCADDSLYNIRIKTTDEGGLSFDKQFVLKMQYVLEHPKPDTLVVNLCQGDSFEFKGKVYDKAGLFYYRQGNDYMCDSVTVLQISVLPNLEAPSVTVEGTCTLVSSVSVGNQWYKDDGTPIDGATGQRFTPTEDGVYYVCVGNGNCMSPPSLYYRVQMSDYLNLSWDLANGWNWVSSSLKSPEIQNALSFLNPIAGSVESFSDGNFSLSQENGALNGNLQIINPRIGYWIKVSKDLQQSWEGQAYRPEDTYITLHNGWNNIGYLPVGENPIEKALSGVSPSENDVIKSFNEFAIYNGGKWYGTLSYMRPGEGYQYLSSRDINFTYPVTRVFELEPQQAKQLRLAEALGNPWLVDAHAYQDNMTIVARLLYKDGQEVPPGVYTIGAFVGNNCRGVGQWIDDRLYLLIHGNDGLSDKIEFKAYNNASGESESLTNIMTFANTSQGNINNPVDLILSDDSGINNIYGADTNYNIYPVPVIDRLYVNGDVDNIERIKILTINGKLMIEETYNDGIDVYQLDAGTYIACIVTNHGIVYKKFIKR